jgi:hypothetical protein
MRIIMKANELFNAAMQLDLTSIKIKLMHQQSGEGWSLDKANAVEKEYRRFLCLMKLSPHESMAPLVDVDTFWHYHILDTVKYAADCEQVFGYFLHHDPYVGLDGTDEDEQFRLNSGERMCELYENLFGDAYPATFDADGHTTAFCAGPIPPHVDSAARSAGKQGAIAFCAGPIPPHVDSAARAAGKQGAIAFCAGPIPPHVDSAARSAGKQGAIAFCAGPIPPHVDSAARSAGKQGAIAFCAGPIPPHVDSAARSAGKQAAIAFCAGPIPPHVDSAARSAGKQGAIAFCAGPIPPHHRLNPLVKDIAGAIVPRGGPATMPRPMPVLPA